MKSTYSEFMQSKYFDGLFNAAIFDGPYRIYFHQNYESLALKIYFLLGQRLADVGADLREYSRQQDIHIFCLVYPDTTKLKYVFDTGNEICSFARFENWDDDLVIGLHTQFADDEMERFVAGCEKQIRDWIQQSSLFQEFIKTKNDLKSGKPLLETEI